MENSRSGGVRSHLFVKTCNIRISVVVYTPMVEKHYDTAELYKAMANPKRLAIIELLAKGEVSVNEIAKSLKITKTNVSQHLSHLRHVGIVKPRRDGLNVFYTLVHEGVRRHSASKFGKA